MKEKRKYVIYYEINGNEIERVIHTTEEKASAIQWFIDTINLNGTIIPAEDYEGEEI